MSTANQAALDALPQAATAHDLRMVVCAAIRHRENNAFMFIGPRHFDQTMSEQIDEAAKFYQPRLPLSDDKLEQGFIDQNGVFMTREEAWGVALAAGQIRYRCGGDGNKLFSENLY